MIRRTWLKTCGAATALWAVHPPSFTQQAAPAAARPVNTLAPLAKLTVYIPGGAGGGWDQTGRALGAAIQSAGLAQQVSYENKGGKGGTIGLTDFVERFNRDPAALLIGGMVMLGAIAVNRPTVTLSQVSPIARLTNDFMVLVTPSGGRLPDMNALKAAMRNQLSSVAFTGGSAGGVDHMLAGMIARQLRLDVGQLKYLPTSSGREAMALLEKGEAQVAISSYSEFQTAIENKSLKPLAASARKSMHGIPSLSELGVNTDLGNWRAVFGPGQISEAERTHLRHIVIAATQTPSWKQALRTEKWTDALMHGEEFTKVLMIEQAMASAVTMMLKLKG
jgi:putative tricarboxylic transport membrane protein